MAEHRLGIALYRNHFHHDVEMGVLCTLWCHRDRADWTGGLVRVDLAQAEGSSLIGCL
jgi:hypothetical protein